jgi:hypothetical protein
MGYKIARTTVPICLQCGHAEETGSSVGSAEEHKQLPYIVQYSVKQLPTQTGPKIPDERINDRTARNMALLNVKKDSLLLILKRIFIGVFHSSIADKVFCIRQKMRSRHTVVQHIRCL